jgi:hypothetical protein
MENDAARLQQILTKLHLSQRLSAACQAGPKPRSELRKWMKHDGPPFTTSDMPSTMPMNLQTAKNSSSSAVLLGLVTFYSRFLTNTMGIRFSTNTHGKPWHANGAPLSRTPAETSSF